VLQALTILLAFQLIGEGISQVLRLPIPGPVVGMGLLLLALAARPRLAEPLRATAQGVLQHLSLLFVPAGVGVMLHARRVADEWVAIAIALVASTVLGIAATALTVRFLAGRRRPKPNPGSSS
jgi:holin-like protein